MTFERLIRLALFIQLMLCYKMLHRAAGGFSDFLAFSDLRKMENLGPGREAKQKHDLGAATIYKFEFMYCLCMSFSQVYLSDSLRK
jgi:hypothetical protein